MLTNHLGRLRLMSYLDGLSYLFLLLIAMPLKYGADLPQVVSVGGMVHGVLFSLYVLTMIESFFRSRWKFGRLMLAIGAAFIPGLFFYHERVLRREM